ncbi:MAG: hypothetical protein ACRD3T_22425, partial [Terriglobia bacterium]
ILLRAPEIDNAQAKYEHERQVFALQAQPGHQMATAVVVWGAAAGKNGDLYVGVKPFRSSEGATVLRFSQTGTLIESLRCPLPTADFAPMFFGISGAQLVLADPGGRVAVYQL